MRLKKAISKRSNQEEYFKMHAELAKLFMDWQIKDYNTELAVWIGLSRFSCFAQLSLQDDDIPDFISEALQNGKEEAREICRDIKYVN
jgi:hypothetical protein|tara:strand:- start:505 stop:768 length:264 start_codon:yes stop_codon:yes gene_type:complete